MHLSEKKELQRLTKERIVVAGSQNKYAMSIGVSSAQITNLLSDNWHKLSDDMLRKLAAACGLKTEDWRVLETKPFRYFINFYAQAKKEGTTFGLIASAGSGKTTAANWYKANHRNVIVMDCAEYWNKKNFLAELLKRMGCQYRGMSIFEMVEAVEDEMLKKSEPLVILDEADKLKDEVLYFFITLYNRLEGHCGIVLQSTEYMRKRMDKGLRLNRRGYSEIFSRVGGRWIQIQSPSSTDISMVCATNNLKDTDFIDKVSRSSNGDMRRVKRMITAEQIRREEVQSA